MSVPSGVSSMDDFGGLGSKDPKLPTPRRRRDTWLHYATIVALFLQVIVAAFPEVCSNIIPFRGSIIEQMRR